MCCKTNDVQLLAMLLDQIAQFLKILFYFSKYSPKILLLTMVFIWGFFQSYQKPVIVDAVKALRTFACMIET